MCEQLSLLMDVRFHLVASHDEAEYARRGGAEGVGPSRRMGNVIRRH